jgi:hypothetical protein
MSSNILSVFVSLARSHSPSAKIVGKVSKKATPAIAAPDSGSVASGSSATPVAKTADIAPQPAAEVSVADSAVGVSIATVQDAPRAVAHVEAPAAPVALPAVVVAAPAAIAADPAAPITDEPRTIVLEKVRDVMRVHHLPGFSLLFGILSLVHSVFA